MTPFLLYESLGAEKRLIHKLFINEKYTNNDERHDNKVINPN